MVTVIQRPQTFAQGLAQGFSQAAQPLLQQQLQRSQLQQAFESMKPGTNFADQLKSIAPTLLTTPGGAQALSELAPLLSKYSEAEAQRVALTNRRSQINQQKTTQTAPGMAIERPSEQTQQESDKFLRPQAPISGETTYPYKTIGYQPQPEMSQADIEDYALDLMEQSQMVGKPMSLQEALPIAQTLANQIVNSNQNLRAQQQEQEAALDKLNAGLIAQARNNGLIKTPEDETMVKKFAYQARQAPQGTDQWEYVRTKMREYDNAKDDLVRTYDQPNLLQKAYRKLTGSYKSKEEAIEDMQGPLDFYRKNGLFDEARDALAVDIGLGAEDTERALFPPSEKEKSALNSFPKNKINEAEIKRAPTGIPHEIPFDKTFEYQFPGEKWNMNPDEFTDFKENLQKYLSDNPDANLIALRGTLNQGKRYSWQDINKALRQLIEEKRFKPNPQQNHQLSVVKTAPLPGLAQQFKFLFEETK